MHSQFIYGEDACAQLTAGVEELVKIVRSTYGPSGNQILLGNSMSVPVSVTSGNGIIQEIDLHNPGTELAKEVAVKLAETEGDGTTTMLVLLENLVKNSMKQIISGVNPVHLRAALRDEAEHVCTWIEEHARRVEDVKTAAELTASSDLEIRKLVCEAFEKVNSDGIVTVRDTKKQESYVETLDCTEIDQGYFLEEMITNPEKFEAVLEHPAILLTDFVISQSEDIVPAMTLAKRLGKPLFIMAQDITGEALATLAVNIRNGKLRTLAVKATAYGERRKEILQDLAAVTGAIVISQNLGDSLRQVKAEHFGEVDIVRSTWNHTYLYGGKGKPENIKKRVDRIKAEIKTSVYEVDRVNLKNRLARVTGGVAVIYAGAPTELEMRAKRQKLKSTVAAVKSILKYGATAGGGIAMLDAAKGLYGKDRSESKTEEEKTACCLMELMLQTPVRQLLENAGCPSFEIIKELERKPFGWGYDISSDRYGNMMDMKIADSAGTICSSIKMAVSLAGMIITAGAIAEREAWIDTERINR